MLFDNSFQLQAPIDEVWRTLLDIERVAPCMPGAQVLERTGEDSYKVAVRVKLGPMSMQYRGDVEILEQDPQQRRAVMKANAKEARGQGTAAAEIEMSLSQEGGITVCKMHTDVRLSGRAAAMGQGVIRDVSAQLVSEFAENLATMVSSGSEAGAPAGGGAPPTASTTAAAAAGAEGGAGATTPGPLPSRAPGDEGASLQAGALIARVVAGRLQNPRTLALAAAVYALMFLALGLLLGWLLL